MFKLVNGDIKINEDLAGGKNIRALIRRDRGGVIEGDSTGTKKLRAFAELGYIWYCNNLNSPGINKGLEGKELDTAARDYFHLPKEWKKDDAFKVVESEYISNYNSSVVVKTIKSLLAGFKRSLGLVDTIDTMLVNIENQIVNTEGDQSPDKLSDFIKLNKELMNITADLPNNIEKLKKLEELYLKEEAKKQIGRGNTVVVNSMNPDK